VAKTLANPPLAERLDQIRLLGLLEDGLDALELGVALFDSEQRLFDCNRLFRKIRGYPAELCQAGTPMRELLQHDFVNGQLGESGQSDPVASWLDSATKRRRHTAESRLPDGRFIATALTPIGAQGSVLTVCDVTERHIAAQALRAERQWLELATEASSEGIYDWNVASGALKVTYRLTAMLGLAPGDLTASDWNKLIHPDDFASYRSTLVAHFRGVTPYLKCEYRVRRSGGDYIWLADNGRCERDAAGRARRLVGAVADVTERKLAEERLARSEQRYTAAMQAINEGVYDWNIEADAVFYTAGVRQALGLTPDQLRTPADWFERIHPSDRERYREAIRAHFRGESPRFALEFRYRGADDSWRWVRQSGIATYNAAGRAVRMVGATGDITPFKRAEIALRESEERYALATEAATEGVYDWNVAADMLTVSDRLATIMQLSATGIASADWNNRVHPADRARYRTTMRAHFRGETRHFSCEYRAQAGTGEYLWIADNATSVRDSAGRVTRLVGAIANISAQKRSEEDLREARLRAENASTLAMQKAQMLEVLSNKLSKYLSPQVYSSIFSGHQNVAIEAKRKKLTIFFSDIVGFTAITDMLESEELTALLNEYLTEMSRIALEHGATIDKFLGDAILAFFGDPHSLGPREDAIACVRMAMAMQRRMQEMQGGWRDRGLDRSFELRIGITTGYCTVGNFGSEDRMDYTVIGNEVNRAARLQGHAEVGGILMSSETHALVKDVIAARDRGEIELKGIPRPVHAYEVTGTHAALPDRAVIAFDQPGIRLLVRPDDLTGDAREAAARALEDAALRLRQTQK
jgi:adenylate cyclase